MVGICLDRSFEMVVALLAIFKSGGAFVPLDPNYPAERLSFMLHDAAVRVIVTRQSLLDRLPNHSAPRVCLDRDSEEIARQSMENPVGLAEAVHRNSAYVIYTSGSTGKPKGVMIEHGSLANALAGNGQTPLICLYP